MSHELHIVEADDYGRLFIRGEKFYNPHIEGQPAMVSGHDNYMTGTGFRGDGICIPVSFESGHHGNLWIVFHKGDLFMRFHQAHGLVNPFAIDGSGKK